MEKENFNEGQKERKKRDNSAVSKDTLSPCTMVSMIKRGC
jgi:hypothetical protein